MKMSSPVISACKNAVEMSPVKTFYPQVTASVNSSFKVVKLGVDAKVWSGLNCQPPDQTITNQTATY